MAVDDPVGGSPLGDEVSHGISVAAAGKRRIGAATVALLASLLLFSSKNNGIFYSLVSAPFNTNENNSFLL
jgi:hypothetical protein